MPDDLPAIDSNPDVPLPQVDPNSQLVPYRIGRTDPSGQTVTTTGYGPRARPPIQPPAGFGGGVGMPDVDRIYQAAFSKLPVDQAVKAVEAATRFIGQRQYQRDLANGVDAITAFQKAAPLMFHQATGLPETFEAQTQRARLAAPTIHSVGGRIYRVPPTTGQAQPISPEPTPKPSPTRYEKVGNDLYEVTPGSAPKKVVEGKARPEPPTQDEKDAWKELDEARKVRDDMLKKPPVSPSKKAVAAYQKSLSDAETRISDARARVARFTGTPPVQDQATPIIPNAAGIKQPVTGSPMTSDFPNPARRKQPTQGTPTPPTVTTKAQYDELESGTVYMGKDGKRYRKP